MARASNTLSPNKLAPGRDSVKRGPSRSVHPRDEVLDYEMLVDFTKKEIGEIREAFDLFDKQGKGIVNIK